MAEQMRTLEQSDIYFVYRPAVDTEEVHGVQDIQRFFVLLHPEGEQVRRLIVIGRKRLPDPADEGERYWGYVEKVFTRDDELAAEFKPDTYETATLGERTVPAERPAGKGVYQIVAAGRDTRLVYRLALPEEPREVQQELNIARAAAYVLTVKNPQASSPAGVGLEPENRAELPEELQQRFGSRRFMRADPVGLLNYPGVEILLIGAGDAPAAAELETPLEPGKKAGPQQVIEELRMEPGEEKKKPLAEGRWQ